MFNAVRYGRGNRREREREREGRERGREVYNDNIPISSQRKIEILRAARVNSLLIRLEAS